MTELLAFANKARNFNAINVLERVLNSHESKEFLIRLNTNSQLFLEGINSEGVKLDTIGGGYSASTINGTAQFEGKKSKGLPTDRITLFDTGLFYDSFRIEINLPKIIIFADANKGGIELTDRWGKDILGLTKKNKADYEDYIARETIDIILQNLFP